MSHSNRGPLATYNSLTDRHLAGFFANSRVREHLRRSGLITAEGEIINDATYRLNMARKDHKKHVKDLLAQAIVHKTLDIERLRQIEVKRRLEEIAKLETVRRIKQTRDRKGEETLLPLLSPSTQPHRQFSARSLHRKPSSNDAQNRPASAPDQEPLQGGDKQKDTIDELPIDALRDYAITMNYEHTKRKDYNPYRVPQIPLPPKKDHVSRQTAQAQRLRQQQLDNKMKMEERPAYAGMEYRKPMPIMVHMPVLQSYCTVIMRYHGYGLNLVRQEIDHRQDIMVDQQHCGGNTRTVFKDMLSPGATFKFSSLRHQGYPFSLTLYIDGKVDCRVSTCCEFGHRPGSKLGHFSFVDIEGSSAKPCYKCQMGLTRPISHRRIPSNPRPQGETVTVVNTRSGAASSQSRPQSAAQEPPTSEENVVVAVEKDEEEAAEEEETVAKSPAPPPEEEAPAEAVGYADDFEEESKHSKEDEEEEQPGKVEGLDDELSDREEPVVRARSPSPAPSQDSSSSSSSSASRSVYSSSFEDDSGSEAGDKPPGPALDQQDAGKKDDEDEVKDDERKDDAPGNDDEVQTPRVKGLGSDDEDDYDDDDDERNARGTPGRTSY